jgi:hypothetical protein
MLQTLAKGLVEIIPWNAETLMWEKPFRKLRGRKFVHMKSLFYSRDLLYIMVTVVSDGILYF